MICVMHWAVKQIRNSRLSHAQTISLSVDDRKDFRLVRYRCSFVPNLPNSAKKQEAEGTGHMAQGTDEIDTGLCHTPCAIEFAQPLREWCKAKPLNHDGILGVFKLGGNVAENTLESHDADKSHSMASSIYHVISQTCQNPDGEVDAKALQGIKSKIRHFCSDQGPKEAKCGKVLAASKEIPNLAWVSFDAAHQVRNAFRDPLRAQPKFQEQWERLFGGRHAL